MAVIEAIATTYLESDVSTVTFSSIPNTYEHLELRMSTRDTYGSGYDSVFARFNSFGSPYYTDHRMYAYNGAKEGGGAFEQSYARLGRNIGTPSGNDSDFCVSVVTIMDYANTNKNTTFTSLAGSAEATGAPFAALDSGFLNDTAVIHTITLYGVSMGSGTFQRGSVFSLYGVTG
tara:strand:+ start:174 stop:698 length:525 start_codon:yes stop_codon:yes gene_type:complete